jgi:hypothetical protein
MDRLLTLDEALALTTLGIDRAGQIGYFVECILGGVHGLAVGDLAGAVDLSSPTGRELSRLFAAAQAAERSHFLNATALSASQYRERFAASPHPSIAAFTGSQILQNA